MKKMDKAEEKRIVEALEKAVKLANDGMSPDDALVKMANEYKFPAESVKRMVEAFNVSKTLAHLKHAKADVRGDSFPIAGVENILGKLYPAEPETPASKSAAAPSQEYGTDDTTDYVALLTKQADMIEIPPLTDKKADPYPRELGADSRQAIVKRAKLEQLHAKARGGFKTVFLKVCELVDKAADYWRKVGPREDFSLVEKRAYATFGPLAGTIMDMIYERGRLDDGRLQIKRASADELGGQQMHFDPSDPPYSYISDAARFSIDLARLRKEAGDIQQTMHEHTLAHVHQLPRRQVCESIAYMLKQAGREPNDQDVVKVYQSLMKGEAAPTSSDVVEASVL